MRIPALFSPAETFTCGQAFRFREVSPGEFEGIAFGRRICVKEEPQGILLSCTPEEFEETWKDYFDLEEDYDAKRAALSSLSPVLREAAAFAPGIRLLRQDPWETLCTFILSQQNNIPRITGLTERLCSLLGDPIPKTERRTFPTPARLAACTPEDLTPVRAGFRAKYLIDAARKVKSGAVDFSAIAQKPADFGRQALQSICGVGPKVAECTLLFGFHKTECFPMDVWMKRAMAVLLPGRSPGDFGENAGLAQQYLFHFSRMHPELFG